MTTTKHILHLLLVAVTSTVATAQSSPPCGTSQRRAWRDTSCENRAAYLEAVRLLKELPEDNAEGIPNMDTFVSIHFQNRVIAHGFDAFLPWHRWYIAKFEEALQRVTNTCLTLPYWDWERDAADEMASSVLETTTFGSSSGTERGGRNRLCVNEGLANFFDFWTSTVRGGCLERAFNQNQQFATETGVLTRITNNADFSTFRPDLEAFPHAAPHLFIGAHMETMFSPDDPLFMLHHANVDRIWAIFQDFRDHDTVLIDDLGTNEYSDGGVALTDPLPFVGANSFFDTSTTSGVRPTPRELHYSNGGIVDVTYVNDNLAYLLKDITAGTNDAYENSNNPAWILIASGPVQSIVCNGDSSPVASPVAPPTSTEAPIAAPVVAPTSTESPVVAPPVATPTDFPCGVNKDSCSADSDCCSFNCKGNACRGGRRRLGQARAGSGPPNFANENARVRWEKLIESGLGPIEVLNVIAKEECSAAGDEFPPMAWIQMQGMENQAHLFNCYPY